MRPTVSYPIEGGCDCGAVRYRLTSAPLFVHCCHCRWCQRESGASFALNAMIESDRVQSIGVEPEIVHTPSDSGFGQKVARCPRCRVAVWSHYAGSGPVAKFVRVGTLDNPDLLPPDVHIFTASKQPWVVIPAGVPAFEEYYERDELWPAESLARRQAVLPLIEAYQASLRGQPGSKVSRKNESVAQVRRADANDLLTLLPLIATYWDFESISGFDARRVAAVLERILSEPKLGAVWIALTDNAPVGYLIGVYVFSLEHMGLTAEIDEFFVLPSMRDAGVGSELLRVAESEFTRVGCTNVSLQLSRGNEAARQFYHRRGYEERSGYELLDKTLHSG